MADIPPHIASQTKGPRILGIFWAFYAVSLLMVSARLYIRARWLKNIGLDDYIIAASMVCVSSTFNLSVDRMLTFQVMLTGYTVVSTVNVGLGYGKHTAVILQDGGMDLLVKILIVNYADFALGIMSFTTPKLAIAALLNRVMNPGRFHRWWLWFLTCLVFVSSTICIVVLFTMCDPPRALWQIDLLSAGQATCRPQKILVGYAIFTGGMSGVALLSTQLDGLSSYIWLRRLIPRRVPHRCSSTVTNYTEEETGIMRGAWNGCCVCD
jgi:hypothetical protein